MTRVLFIGPYRQSDGWGNAANEYAKAIATSCELAIRPVYMGSSFCELHEDLLEYEFNDFREYDVVIQNCLPHLAQYKAGMKNILLCHLETYELQNTSWLGHANLMDEVWVPSAANKMALLGSGLHPDKVKVVPIPCNTEKYHHNYGTLSIPNTSPDDFKFYFIGEFVQRKNLVALISAFHAEFEPYEDVQLVIKANKSGMSPIQLSSEINGKITSIKSRLRMFPSLEQYKKDIVVTDMLPEDHLMALHDACDCFVMPSHGESWSIPTFEAMAMGNPCIVPNYTGMTQYVNEDNGWVVDTTLQPCMTKEAPLPDIYTGRERWQHINIQQLMDSMREAYQNKDAYKLKSKKCLEDFSKYSYEDIGSLIKDLLK